MSLSAPFPYFGGKSRAAPLMWSLLGDVPNYIEPFAGSAAMLLARPGGAGKVETINDALLSAGWTAHFWKARKGYAQTDEAKANSQGETVWASPACKIGEPATLL